MLIIITSRSSSKMGHVGSKTRSLGQIIEKPCVHSRGHSFDHKLMKICQNVNHHNNVGHDRNWVMLGQKLGH